MRYRGFSIPETLMALAVIGVASSLVIPSMLGLTSQTQYKTRLKKAVFAISNGISLNITNGKRSAYYTNSSTPLFQYLQNNIKVLNALDTSYRNSNNSQFFTKDNIRYEFPKADNTASAEFNNVLIGGENWTVKNSKCGTKGLDIKGSPAAQKVQPCIILVDVNGDAPPNKLTPPNADINNLNDMFLIIISDTMAIPYGETAQKVFYGH